MAKGTVLDRSIGTIKRCLEAYRERRKTVRREHYPQIKQGTRYDKKNEFRESPFLVQQRVEQ